MSEELVVVGGSVATTSFLERLRQLGETRPIMVIDGDGDAPYDRPPLSKRFLIQGDFDDLAVDWSDLDATLVHGWAVGVRPESSVVHIRNNVGGEWELAYEQLVIATGATPVRLPIEPSDTLTLRSAEDARRLRALAGDGQRVTVIGAGAIGVELASSLVERGSHVTLLDRAHGPLERLLPGHLANDLTRWLAATGVDCRWGVNITAIRRTGSGWQVNLDDGTRLDSDVVVSAVGARPSVEWLSGTSLLTDGMLLANDSGRVVNSNGVVARHFAIGDVVSRLRPDGSIERTESWAAARQHGAQLAEELCGVSGDRVPEPYFWTEVAGRKIQVVGSLRPSMELDVEFENPELGGVLYRASEGDSVAWIGVNAQSRIAQLPMGG